MKVDYYIRFEFVDASKTIYDTLEPWGIWAYKQIVLVMYTRGTP